jgi:hypothetical protein
MAQISGLSIDLDFGRGAVDDGVSKLFSFVGKGLRHLEVGLSGLCFLRVSLSEGREMIISNRLPYMLFLSGPDLPRKGRESDKLRKNDCRNVDPISQFLRYYVTSFVQGLVTCRETLKIPSSWRQKTLSMPYKVVLHGVIRYSIASHFGLIHRLIS